jgi:hypothetical protein
MFNSACSFSLWSSSRKFPVLIRLACSAVVEAKSNQRHTKIIDGRPGKGLDVSAELIAEISYPTAAKHLFREDVFAIPPQPVLTERLVQSVKRIEWPRFECDYLFWLRRPITVSTGSRGGGVAAEDRGRFQPGKDLAQSG